MLSLNDPAWGRFQANYPNGTRVAELLSLAESGAEVDRWHDQLLQELCHQYTVSEAAIPAGPHLLRLASESEQLRKPLLVLLGMCHAFHEPSQLKQVPGDVQQAWDRCAADAIPLIADLLAQPQPSESDLRYLMGSLAALGGYPALARAIEAIDVDQEGP